MMVVLAGFLFADRARIAALTLRRLMLMAFGRLSGLCHEYFSPRDKSRVTNRPPIENEGMAANLAGDIAGPTRDPRVQVGDRR